MYALIRPLLFKLDAEAAHDLTLKLLKCVSFLIPRKQFNDPVTIAGCRFENRIGLAAGLDKNGRYINELAKLGFGYIEVGTVTPRPQSGNTKPRLFRLVEDEAIINRMGFNNNGIDALIENVKKANFKGVLGINIGKNADTPIENAVDDYLICMRKAYEYASYITINISSPNTKNLRDLQSVNALDAFLGSLKAAQIKLKAQTNKSTPLFVKVAPDLSEHEIKDIAALLIKHQIEGLIATNTVVDKPTLKNKHRAEQGGLSGKPIFERSLSVVKQFANALNGQVPIVGVGGINSKERMQAMFDAGASAVQVYSGLIYDAGLVSKLLVT